MNMASNTVGKNRVKTLTQKLNEVVPDYITKFILWYKSDETKRKPFEEIKDHNITDYDICLEWLTREDAQDALQVYEKHMKKFKLMELYNSMYDKAMTGDVNAAKFVESFSNSSFFDDTTDEIDDFMKSVNIPSLKKGGKNGSK